jgi:hypothetical protein
MNENIKVYNLTNDIPVYVKTDVDTGLNFNRILEIIRSIVPEKLFNNSLQNIMVGNFKGLNNKNVDSGYESGVIYIGEEMLNKSEEEMVESIVHELAHVMEDQTGNAIKNNHDVKAEFLDKRMKLYQDLQEHGLEPDIDEFMNEDYDSRFDSYLMHNVGYDTIKRLSSSYMIDPYAFTDIREYIAMNFEKYALGKVSEVRQKGRVIGEFLGNIL